MIRAIVVLVVLIGVGLLKIPVERHLAALHRQEHFRGVEFNLDLREQIGQLGGVRFYLPRMNKTVWEWRHDGAKQG